MNYGTRVGQIATSATVTIMCLVVVAVIPLAAAWVNDITTEGTALSALAASVIAVLTSGRVYRSVAEKLTSLGEDSNKVRSFILGRNYIHGTWVGRIIRDDDTFYTIEFIEQSPDRLVISGVMYYDNGQQYATWDSEVAQIDPEGKVLKYSYKCKKTTIGSIEHRGLGDFKLKRKNKNDAPYILDGDSTDLIDNERDPNIEYKIDDEELIGEVRYERAVCYFKALNG